MPRDRPAVTGGAGRESESSVFPDFGGDLAGDGLTVEDFVGVDLAGDDFAGELTGEGLAEDLGKDLTGDDLPGEDLTGDDLGED